MKHTLHTIVAAKIEGHHYFDIQPPRVPQISPWPKRGNAVYALIRAQNGDYSSANLKQLGSEFQPTLKTDMCRTSDERIGFAQTIERQSLDGQIPHDYRAHILAEIEPYG